MALTVNEQHREQVCQLLTEAVTMLCKNMLTYSTNLCIEGLIGVTTDNSNVILVNIKETISNVPILTEAETSEYNQTQRDANTSSPAGRSRQSKLKRRRISNSSSTETLEISQEVTEEKNNTEAITQESYDCSAVKNCLKSIKLECEPVSCTSGYDEGCINQPVINHPYSGSSDFENNLLASSAQTVLPACSSVGISRLPTTLPESTQLPWRQTKASEEEISTKDIYELNDLCQFGEFQIPHSNQSSYAFGKEKDLVTHSRAISNDTTKKYGPLSFTVQQDPNGSEVFKCECGEPFRHRSSLYRHQMTHLGMAYRCDSCGIVMNRKDNLLTHKRRYCLAQKQVNAKSLRQNH